MGTAAAVLAVIWGLEPERGEVGEGAMRAGEAWRELWQEIRCALAEWCGGWALRLVPKGSFEHEVMARTLLAYIREIRPGQQQRQERILGKRSR